MKKLGFIGVGNMAGAILTSALNNGYLKEEEVIIYDVNELQYDKYKNFNIDQGTSELDIVLKSDMVFMGVKPQVIESVVVPLREELKNKAVLSIVLGYDFNKYNELLDESTRHIFVMPNTPVLVNEGMSLIEKSHSLTDEEFKFVEGLFNSFGSTEILDSHLMGVGGALSGCGPAYIYLVIEALADGAVKEGLPRNIAYKLASQTVLGAGKMQLETGLHPGILKDNVCSPGGSTIRGVYALEQGSVRSLFIEAIEKANGK